jgi:hypothetical protein
VLLLDFPESPFLLLLDTGSSGLADEESSPPQAANRNADMTHIANIFFIQSSKKHIEYFF